MYLFLNKLKELDSHGIDMINLDCITNIYVWVNEKKELVLQVYYKYPKEGSWTDEDDKKSFDYFHIAEIERQEYIINQLCKFGLK